ncbi:MAG: prolyl oligopeptidase family serine peptidase [Pseudomonadota bacterium]|nr:prolyl oligopeptidase family serine peptidase [Pseudomonadota bacterium]
MQSCIFSNILSALTTVLLAAVGAAVAGSANAQSSVLSAADFAQTDRFTSATLSPDGTKIAFFMHEEGRTFVAVMDVPVTSDHPIIHTRSLHSLQTPGHLVWASENRLLYSVFWTRSFINRRRERVLTHNSTLFSATPDLETVLRLDERPADLANERGDRPQYLHRIVDIMEDDPDHILQALNWRIWHTADLVRVNVVTGDTYTVDNSVEGAWNYIVDSSGRARVVMGQPPTRRGNARPYLRVRGSAAGSQWHDISQFIQDPSLAFIPFGFGSDPDILYVGANHRTDTISLYPFDMRTGELGELIYSNPQYDLNGIIVSSETDDLIGVRYVADEPERHYFSEEAERAMQAISARMGGGSITTHDVSEKSNRFLVFSSDADRPTTLHLFDMTTGDATLIGSNQPHLADAQLGTVHSVSFTARDGLEIPGYITLPPGLVTLDEAAQLPFVVLVHGGPAARDFRRFDYLSQFLATRGYGVMQVNFRGSTGLGREFRDAGAGEWGLGMQDDVDDAARWLIDHHYADPNRVAVAGFSYGGYAAMMGVTRTGSPFVAGISINGVSDLTEMRDHARNFAMGRRAFDAMLDGVNLSSMSPVSRAADLDRPLLLVQALEDTVVPPDQGRLMHEALDEAGRDYVYLELRDADHSVSDRRNRQNLLEAMEDFLDTVFQQ